METEEFGTRPDGHQKPDKRGKKENPRKRGSKEDREPEKKVKISQDGAPVFRIRYDHNHSNFYTDILAINPDNCELKGAGDEVSLVLTNYKKNFNTTQLSYLQTINYLTDLFAD